jgi:hypothetical protein
MTNNETTPSTMITEATEPFHPHTVGFPQGGNNERTDQGENKAPNDQQGDEDQPLQGKNVRGKQSIAFHRHQQAPADDQKEFRRHRTGNPSGNQQKQKIDSNGKSDKDPPIHPFGKRASSFDAPDDPDHPKQCRGNQQPTGSESDDGMLRMKSNHPQAR